ncbi:MAG: hypothetical protein CSA55_05530 [Ilumatobacter coccineus]|uniref:Uncharacterized protein n=1 Tax=Ilumatobacter coccineus TaxID=467094 RepID=A0A2G6K779_9ACTN|nr:MAG: hypothetical protein CSA55_05530 [Ilumatobacter coccineus]
MNTRIRRLAAFLMALYVILFAALNYWQVGHSDELAVQPGNTRAIIRQFDQPRGPIITADGVTVAESVLTTEPGSDVTYQRHYPTGDLFANIVGYYTFGLGSTQLERTRDKVLTGSTFTQQVHHLNNLLSTETDNSGELHLTLRADLQRTARDLLGDREGSIVLLEPDTGAIRAMWSWPSYDPNVVASPDYDEAYDYVTELQDDPRDPLLANTYQQRYTPGSTFKVITAGAGLDAGVITLESEWESLDSWTPPQTTRPITNYGGKACGGDLTEVFAQSCNIPFGQIALELGADQFVDYVSRWSIGEPIPIDLPRPASSTLGDITDLDQQLPLLAMRGFGQNEIQMVPLHLALVAATVANDGEMMTPYVVDSERDHKGRVLSTTQPSRWRQPITRRTANILTEMMRAVAESGTASCCIGLDGGISVAAKTGTAELTGTDDDRSHAWIIAFAPVEDPQYAVAVLVKGTADSPPNMTGGRTAGPIAKAMLDAALATDRSTEPPSPDTGGDE